MRVQDVHRLGHRHRLSLPIVREPAGRVRGHTGDVNRDVQVAKGVVGRVDRRVQVRPVRVFLHRRTPFEAHVAVAEVAAVAIEAYERQGVGAAQVGHTGLYPGGCLLLGGEAGVRLGLRPPVLRRQGVPHGEGVFTQFPALTGMHERWQRRGGLHCRRQGRRALRDRRRCSRAFRGRGCSSAVRGCPLARRCRVRLPIAGRQSEQNQGGPNR